MYTGTGGPWAADESALDGLAADGLAADGLAADESGRGWLGAGGPLTVSLYSLSINLLVVTSGLLSI
jgi:hypothetical protein